MRNLKRALSLVLAAMMLVGMMVVGASAASFPDSDKIEHEEAVNSMVALGIIKGKDNGNFDPEGNVTRAEMAKMICVAMNGGKDPKLTGSAAYSDTVNHWAAGYIQWCTNLRYVSGYNGMFRPDDSVTATEAAKMLLVALGYNAQQEKYENDANWDSNINLAANLKGILDDVAVDLSAPLSRDNAAQMMWNACNAEMVKYDFQGFIVDGTSITVAVDNGKTILEEKFDLKTGYGYMTGISYDSKKEEYTYSFSKDAFGDEITEDVVGGTMKSKNDYSDLFGVKTKILYKDNSDKTVYGMYADGAVVFEGSWSDVEVAKDGASAKLDGTKFELDGDAINTIAYNAADADADQDGLKGWYAVKAIDNDDDGEVDVITYVPTSVVKVTFVGKESITAGGQSYKYDEADIYEDVKKSDYVVLTAAANTKNDTPVIVKAEVITDTIQATRDGEVKVDGVWYKLNGDVTAKLGDEMELVVLNGYIFNGEAKAESANVENAVYALLVDDPGEAGSTKEGTQVAKLLFADGSKKTVTVDKVDGEKPAAANAVEVDTIYTYKTDKDGNYELSVIDVKDFDKDDAAVELSDTPIKDGKFAVDTVTYRFATDAVVFVKAGDEVKVVPAATINDWADYTASSGITYINKKSGFGYVALGAIELDGVTKVPGVAGDTSYGWITAAPSVVKDGDDTCVELTLWNGEKVITVLTDDETTINESNHVKGTPVSFKDLGNGRVEDVVALTTKDAVTAYAGGKDIQFKTTGAAEINDDTVILYVNTKDNEGVEGGEIVIADEDSDGNTVNNVYVEVDDGKVTILIVDVNNEVYEAE